MAQVVPQRVTDFGGVLNVVMASLGSSSVHQMVEAELASESSEVS